MTYHFFHGNVMSLISTRMEVYRYNILGEMVEFIYSKKRKQGTCNNNFSIAYTTLNIYPPIQKQYYWLKLIKLLVFITIR